MAEFCRIHAFYDCPVCRGEEVVWVIPIVDGSDPFGHGGNVVGTIEIPESFGDDLAYYEVPWEGPGKLDPPMPVAVNEIEATPDPRLLERVKEIFAVSHRPEYAEAAARGRQVHEDALAMMDADNTLSYQEAIEFVLQERGHD